LGGLWGDVPRPLPLTPFDRLLEGPAAQSGRKPHPGGLRVLLPRQEFNRIGGAARPAHPAAEAAGWVDIHLTQQRGIELRPELALLDALLAAVAEVHIDAAYVLGPEEAGNSTLFDIALVCHAVVIAIAEADQVRRNARPDAVDQALLVVFPDDPLGLFFVEDLQRRRRVRDALEATPLSGADSEAVAGVVLVRSITSRYGLLRLP
jgi:hypothetical protein